MLLYILKLILINLYECFLYIILQIPVFKGAHAPLLCTPNVEEAVKDQYHGSDGFGDVYNTKVDTSTLQPEHAVCALNRITSECPSKITIVCLGPLTNIALAMKMYSTFINNIKEFYIMGGNITGNFVNQYLFILHVS